MYLCTAAIKIVGTSMQHVNCKIQVLSYLGLHSSSIFICIKPHTTGQIEFNILLLSIRIPHLVMAETEAGKGSTLRLVYA